MTLLLLVALAAVADPSPPGDPMELLWGHRLDLGSGEPTVAIRIVEGRDEVVLASSGPAALLPRGAVPAELPTGTRLVARVRGGTPARVVWRPLLADREAGDREGIEGVRATWAARGVPTRVRTTGGVYGLAGHVVDNRRALVLADRPGSEADAAAFGAEAWKRWGERPEPSPELLARPSGRVELLGPGGEVRVAGDGVVTLDARGAPVSVEGKEHRGRILLAVDSGGKLAAVLVLPLEDLLRGVVPSEMPASAPGEALRAQSVTARSNVLAQIGTRHLADPFSLCNDVHCQAYRGEAARVASTDAAVQATRGEVLLDPRGRLVDGVYSAMCGGHGEDNEKVWAGTPSPSLRGRPDLVAGSAAWPGGLGTDAAVQDFLRSAPPSWCGRAPGVKADRYRWQRRIPQPDLDRMLAPLGVGAVDGLTVLRRGASGRSLSVRVDGERGSATVHGELRIRRLLGDLPSALFVVERDGDAILLRGGGWGHGVGLCQWGAIGRAAAGQGYGEILRGYYSGAEGTRIY